jgi:dolichol-phosphate mannosyltransferase
MKGSSVLDGSNSKLHGAELSVIVPTFNEISNVSELIKRLDSCLAGYSWEVIFVDDDSPDGTAQFVREFALKDHRVRCVQRIARRGLSSAAIEGMLASSAPYLAVIDGDLQHDETLLPKMLESLKQEQIDVVVGSRYIEGGSLGEWDKSRAAISKFATKLSKFVIKADLSDPMSGFFMIRREVLADTIHNLSAIGFKLLLDFFASSPYALKYKELPYEFRTRVAGESKLDASVAWDYMMILLDKLVGHIIPVRFITFAAVGGLGVVFHFIILGTLFNIFNVTFFTSQAVSTIIVIGINFAINNILTYRDMRLRGWKWFQGLISFTLVCSVGAIANVGIAQYIFEMDSQWVVAGLAGIAVGAVWNYALSSVYTWNSKPKKLKKA